MPPKSRKPAPKSNLIASNKKARHDYVLEGWEVKSARDGRVQLRESYVALRDAEAWLVGCHITPLTSASTHVQADPVRERKLLLHRDQLDRLRAAVERRGNTVVPTRMYWLRGRAKLEIATARGKQKQDKRASERDRDWQRQRERMLKAR